MYPWNFHDLDTTPVWLLKGSTSPRALAHLVWHLTGSMAREKQPHFRWPAYWGGIWEFQSTQQGAFRQFQTKMSMKPKDFPTAPFVSLRFNPRSNWGSWLYARHMNRSELQTLDDMDTFRGMSMSYLIIFSNMSFVVPAGCFFFRVKRAPPTLEPWDYSTGGPNFGTWWTR